MSAPFPPSRRRAGQTRQARQARAPLAAMALLACLALAHGWRETTLNVFFAGSILFAISDLILSGTYFGEGRERPVDLALNYLTYYGGQFLIASSLVALAR